MQTSDAVNIKVFHPYMLGPNPHPTELWQNYIGQTGTFSLIWRGSDPDGTPTNPQLRAHDEITPGGHPIGGATGAPGPMGPQGLQGVAGPQGPQGPMGPPGADSTAAGPQGPMGPPGTDGIDGTDGADGVTPVPVWTGTSLEWQTPGGTVLAGPVDLVGPMGPAGANGSTVTFSANSDGTTTFDVGGNTVTVGAQGVRDLEFNPATGRLWITTLDGNEEVVFLEFMTQAEHDASLTNHYANDGATVLFRAH